MGRLVWGEHCIPPCRRAYFLLLCQKKVAKEKATPVRRRAAPGALRYSAGRAARMNSPAAQTMRAEGPRPACVARRLPRGPTASTLNGHSNKQRRMRGAPHFSPNFRVHRKTPIGSPISPGRRRATQGLAEKGRGLSEARRAEFRSPRQGRVAQGTGRSPAPTRGRLLLCLLSSWRSKKKVMSRVRRETPPPSTKSAQENRKAT